MTNTIKYLGLILIFSVIGFIIRDSFFELSLSQLANENTRIVSFGRTLSGQFYFHILFALSIGLIPLLYLTIKKMTKLNFINQGLVSCGIIVLCGILLWQFRISQMNNLLQKLSKFDMGNGIQTQMDLGTLNLELYLFIGFLIGTIVSILIFKNKTKTVTE